jgi:hypothetical protein
LRENPTAKIARDTFDFNDLNAYLLVVLGLATPPEDQREHWIDLAKRAKAQEPIPIREATAIAQKPPLITLSQSNDLSKAIEMFGSGVSVNSFHSTLDHLFGTFWIFRTRILYYC